MVLSLVFRKIKPGNFHGIEESILEVINCAKCERGYMIVALVKSKLTYTVKCFEFKLNSTMRLEVKIDSRNLK